MNSIAASRALLAVSTLIASVMAGSAQANAREDVLERIRPVGRVAITGKPQPVPIASGALTAPAAPAEVPAPKKAEAMPAPAAPVAAVAPAVKAAPTAAAGDGEAIYRKACFACHDGGVAGAPKLGDAQAWQPRIDKGLDALMKSAINGVPGTGMVPRGTCAACSDADLRAAIDFMVSKVN